MASLVQEGSLTRERVLEGERELEKRLEGLVNVEHDILALGSLRKRWLTSVSNIDEVESETYHLRLETLRAHAELTSLNVLVDRGRLEGQYELQALNYLVASTKPMDDVKETSESRNRLLTHLARENMETLRSALRDSVEYRAKLARQVHEMIGILAKFRVDHDNRHKSVVDEVQERIGLYAERMREAVSAAKRQHHRITGEYLLLRHNARVAREVLVRNQNEAAMARKILQEKLERLVDEAAAQRERMEGAAATELKIMTDDIRSEVIRKESEVNQLRTRIELLDTSRKATHRELKRDLRRFEKKYDELNTKRCNEVLELAAELKMLRDMVARVEQELYRASHSEALFFAQPDVRDVVASLEADVLKQLSKKIGSSLRPPPPPHR
jgi:uncharacterized protein YxjI